MVISSIQVIQELSIQEALAFNQNHLSKQIENKKQIELNDLEIDKEQAYFLNDNNYLYPDWKKETTLNNNLKVKSRNLRIKKVYKCNKIFAYDVETYKGKCRLLACNIGKHTSIEPSFLDCLKFLYYKAETKDSYRFFYNIDFDFSAILKTWKSIKSKVRQKWILKKIGWLKDGITIKYKGYNLTWIKSRMFTIQKGHKKTVIFTDIANFFHLGLNKSSEKYLKEFKIDNIDGNLLNTSLDYWNKREQDIIKYCIQDCVLTERLAKLLIERIEIQNLPLPKFLVSSASLSKQNFRKKCFISRISVIPRKILEIGYNSYYGGRFEIFKKGFFDNLYLYDINSQYPHFIKDLPNLRNGLWKRTLTISNNPSFSFYLIELDIPKDYKIPTIPIKHNGVNKFPVGKIKKWLTWYDIDLLRDFITKVYDGYTFIESSKSITNPIDNSKPFKFEIEKLFKQKQELKNILELDYEIVKICMNGVYGCFIEVHKNYDVFGNTSLNTGIMFNSVYASQITAFGRWSVIKDIPKEKYNNVIGIHTDSIISNIPLNKYLIQDLEIGNWNKEGEGKGIILNTGMYQIGYLVKTRGIPKKYIKTWLRFCLKNQIYKKKEFKIPHMRKLSEGLIRDKSLINVNIIMNDTRSVNCNSDTKRDWLKDFRSFKEVLNKNIDSYPLICYNDLTELHPNPLCVAYRFEN